MVQSVLALLHSHAYALLLKAREPVVVVAGEQKSRSVSGSQATAERGRDELEIMSTMRWMLAIRRVEVPVAGKRQSRSNRCIASPAMLLLAPQDVEIPDQLRAILDVEHCGTIAGSGG